MAVAASWAAPDGADDVRDSAQHGGTVPRLSVGQGESHYQHRGDRRDQRDARWYEHRQQNRLHDASRALHRSALPRGVRGPLTRIHPRPGQPTASQPHYRLADYLEQTDRRLSPAPAPLWDALVAHARRDDLPRLAAQARDRGLYRHAFQLYAAAADAGHSGVLWTAAIMLAEAGRSVEAVTWLRSRATAGDTSALEDAARMLVRMGRLEDAIALYQQAAEAGDAHAMRQVAGMLQRMGRFEEAIAFYQQAAEAGDTRAMRLVARMLDEAGRNEEAITWLRSRAAPGDIWALEDAARMLDEAGANRGGDRPLPAGRRGRQYQPPDAGGLLAGRAETDLRAAALGGSARP